MKYKTYLALYFTIYFLFFVVINIALRVLLSLFNKSYNPWSQEAWFYCLVFGVVSIIIRIVFNGLPKQPEDMQDIDYHNLIVRYVDNEEYQKRGMK